MVAKFPPIVAELKEQLHKRRVGVTRSIPHRGLQLGSVVVGLQYCEICA
jgi:hypothetical protein